MSAEKQYIDLYTECREMIEEHSAPLMNALREKAFEDFKQLGFPTRKQERYKYTDVAKSFEPDYGLNLKRLDIPVNPYDAFKCDVPNLSTSLYFMVNDQFYDKALPGAQLPDGVFIGSLLDAAKSDKAGLIEKYYGKLARTHKDALNALNTMLVQDGLFVYIPKGVVVERPIQVVNILRSNVDLMVNRRVLVVLEEGAEAKLLFCDHAADDKEFLTTQIMEVYAGENAHLELYELEETHVKNHRFSNLYADQKAYSTVTLDNIALHNGVTRNRTDLTLNGEYAECTLNGLVIADKEQKVDNNTLIDHKAAHCQSHELYKYVLDDKAECAFAGRVLVREGSQQTVSEETNANLLGSKEARIYTQPMLEIYADDVKCSHGSSTGQLGDEQLFYMRQRGIPLEEARMLLKFAFAADVLDTIRMDALRDRLHYLVDKRFRGELSKCEGCKLCK